MRRWIFSIVAVWFFGATGFSGWTGEIPKPMVERLPNGLELVWFTNDKLPLIDYVLMVKSGYRDDLVGKAGTAELLAASLQRGSAGVSAQEIAQSIEKLGASRSVSAEEDTFHLGLHGLASDQDRLLELLSKTALRPDFLEAEVKREHDRLMDRWTHIGDQVETLVALAYHRLVAAGSPYGRGNFLSLDEFKKVGRDDIVSYYKTHFTPKNSILMVVGRADPAVLRPKIIKAFEGWTGEAPKRSEKQKFTDPRLKSKAGDIVLVDRPNLSQAQVRLGFPGPSIHSPDRYALVVGNALLGEYFNSRLNSVIRDQLGLTYAIGSSFVYSQDFGVFSIGSSTRNETVGQLLQKTLDILEKFKKDPIPAEEVKTAKEYLVGGFPLGVATLGSIAARWLGGWIYEMGPDYLNEFVPKVSAIDAEQVSAAIKRNFHLDRLVVVIAGDAKAVEKGLNPAQKAKLKRVTVRDLM